MDLRLEFTIEPFVQGDPGPHVHAGLQAAAGEGVTVDFGPFGTTVAGPSDPVLDAAGRILRAAIGAGATRISLQVARAD